MIGWQTSSEIWSLFICILEIHACHYPRVPRVREWSTEAKHRGRRLWPSVITKYGNDIYSVFGYLVSLVTFPFICHDLDYIALAHGLCLRAPLVITIFVVNL